MKRQKGYGTTLKVKIFVPHANNANFADQVAAGKFAEEIVRLFSDLADTLPEALLCDAPVAPTSRGVTEMEPKPLPFTAPAVA